MKFDELLEILKKYGIVIDDSAFIDYHVNEANYEVYIDGSIYFEKSTIEKMKSRIE